MVSVLVEISATHAVAAAVDQAVVVAADVKTRAKNGEIVAAADSAIAINR